MRKHAVMLVTADLLKQLMGAPEGASILGARYFVPDGATHPEVQRGIIELLLVGDVFPEVPEGEDPPIIAGSQGRVNR
jgi:hypothetical protein